MGFFKRYRWAVKLIDTINNIGLAPFQNLEGSDESKKSLHFRVTIKILITALLLSVNLLKINTYTESASVSVFKKIVSGNYPITMRDNIVVIAFNDADFPLVKNWDINPFSENDPLPEMSNAWPLSAIERQKFLELVSDAEPAAIFVDLYMPSQRTDTKTELNVFKQSLEQIVTQKQIPVLLADLPVNQRNQEISNTSFPGILPLIRDDKSSPVKLVMAGWDNYTNGYPLFIDPVCGNTRKNSKTFALPKSYSCDQETVAPSLSAANALYAIYKRMEDNGKRSGEIDPSFAIKGREMSVMWGNKTFRDKDEEDSGIISLLKNIKRTFLLLLTTKEQSMFHSELSGKEIINLAQNNELDKVLKGKFVIIGANIDGINDVHLSPVHGLVPAAHLHAMALDNLMNDGNRYARLAPKLREIGINSRITSLDFFKIFMIILVFYWSEALSQRRQIHNDSRWRYSSQLFIKFNLLLFAFTAVIWWTFRWIPTNFMMLLLLSIVTFIPVVHWTIATFENATPRTQKQLQIGLSALIIPIIFYQDLTEIAKAWILSILQ